MNYIQQVNNEKLSVYSANYKDREYLHISKHSKNLNLNLI
jgi:hypothetical protein